MTRYFIKYTTQGNSLVSEVLYSSFSWFDTVEDRNAFIREQRAKYGDDFHIYRFGDNAESERLIKALKAAPLKDVSGKRFNTDESILRRR